MKFNSSITLVLLCIAITVEALPPQVRLNRLPYFQPPPPTVHPIRLQRNTLDLRGLRDYKDYKLLSQRFLLPSLQNSLKQVTNENIFHDVYRVADNSDVKLAEKRSETYFERLYPSSHDIN